MVLSINLLLMIVIGGLGSIHGAFFGAIIVGVLPILISFSRDKFLDGLGINLYEFSRSRNRSFQFNSYLIYSF